MAYLMKLLFPNTLDEFQDDFSIKVIDQKPIILHNINLIIQNITNSQNNNGGKDYTLAANHCFIYSNEEEGQQLNNLYGDNIYKLNIEESKGLEFEMVIVYNFFSSSKFQKLWNKIFKKLKGGKNNDINSSSLVQLNNILCQENIESLINTLNLMDLYSDLEGKVKNQKQNMKNNEKTEEKDENIYNEIKKTIMNELKDFVYPINLNENYDKHEIFEFCSELKQFYVIITRPKTFLVFYESNLDRDRNEFFEFMKSEEIKIP